MYFLGGGKILSLFQLLPSLKQTSAYFAFNDLTVLS